VNIDISITNEDVERIACRTSELLSERASTGVVERWLDVSGAADHLALTPHAIRGLVKRRRIPFHRTESNRLRFSPTELDHWVRAGQLRRDP
jgi:excisionase family DNA binding protein